MRQADIDLPKQGSFLRKLWALSWPFFWSEHRGIARLLVVVILVLTLVGVGNDVFYNYWYKDFYNALQNRNEPEFWHQLRRFSIIAAVGIVIAVYSLYLKQMLLIRWRKWMTERLLARWLRDQTYYRLRFTGNSTDNPEQRIEQDIQFFTANAIDLSFGLLGAVVTLCSFVGVLWSVSGPLDFKLGGMAISIPGYMVWVALIYAVVGSGLTYVIGRPLIKTNFELQRSNASFRFGMTRVRQNAESIAFYRGESTEQRELDNLFGRVWGFWWDYMRQQKRLSWFGSGYTQIAIIFPFVVAAPRYFSGAIDLGVLLQIATAFGSVQGALSWFVTSFGGTNAENGLAFWKATIDRLTGFLEDMERAKALKPGIAAVTSDGPALGVEDLDLTLPDGRTLIRGFSANIKSGDKVLISGPSGAGKTTLFRALAGIWPFGRGRLRVPAGANVLFLPQRPYLPLGTLRHALVYPAGIEGLDDAALRGALADVNLERLSGRLGEEADWSHELSIGEQQRVALARALLLKPDWLYLDEATSALDAANEQRIYKLLAERLPNATVLSIAHRPEVARFHQRRLAIDPDSTAARIDAIAAE